MSLTTLLWNCTLTPTESLRACHRCFNKRTENVSFAFRVPAADLPLSYVVNRLRCHGVEIEHTVVKRDLRRLASHVVILDDSVGF